MENKDGIIEKIESQGIDDQGVIILILCRNFQQKKVIYFNLASNKPGMLFEKSGMSDEA
jgi:hypothetical protein